MSVQGDTKRVEAKPFQSYKLTFAQKEFDSFDPEESEADFMLSLPIQRILDTESYKKEMKEYVLRTIFNLSVQLRIAKQEDVAEKEEYMWWQKI